MKITKNSTNLDIKKLLINSDNIKAHTREVQCLLEIDEKTIASGSYDNTIKVWDIKTQKELFTLKGHEDLITSLVKIDEKTIASGSSDGTIKVWDIKTQKELFTLKGHEREITSLVKIDEKTIASGSHDKTIKVWDIKTQKELFTLKGHESVISSLVKLDEKTIASGSHDETIKVWDIKTQKELFTLKGHESVITSLVKLDEKTIASGSHDKTIKVWDIKTQKELFTLKGHESIISSLVKLDEKTIASGSYDKTIKVWDIKTQKELFTLKGHEREISILVKIDEKTIASVSYDKTIKVWDIKTQKELFTLKSHEDWITSLVKIDEKTIASGSSDGTIKVWDIKTQKEFISIPIENESIYFENNTLIVKNKTKIKFINIENLLNPMEIEDKTIVLKSLIENIFIEENSLILSTLCGDLYFDEIVLAESTNPKIDDFTKNELHIKTLLLGDSGVGKTTLGYWLENENFNEDIHSTHGMRFFEYICPEEINVKLPDGKQSKHKFVLDIWDFGGQPEYQISHKQNFEKARIIILVIDLQRDDNSESYWINSIKEHRNKMIKNGLQIYVVGTKSKNKEKDEKKLEKIKEQIDKNINDILEIKYFISNVEKNHESCDLIKSIKEYFGNGFELEGDSRLVGASYRAYLEIKAYKKSNFYLDYNFLENLRNEKNIEDGDISIVSKFLEELGSIEKLDKYYILKPYWKNLFATAILRYVQENDVVKSSISLNDILDYEYEVKFDKLFDLEIKNEKISDEEIYKEQFKSLPNDLKELFSKELIANFIDDKICYFKNGMFVFPSRFLYKEGFEKNKYFELDSISLVSKKQVEETIGIIVTSIFYSPKYTILKHLNKGVKIKENNTGDLYLLEFIREDLINQKKNQENTQIKIYAKNDNKEKNKELISLLKLLLINNLNSVYEKYQYLIKVDNKDVGSLTLTLNSQYKKDVLDELEASKLSEKGISLEKETILNLDKRDLEEIKSNHLKKKDELFKKIEKRISNKNDKKDKRNILHLSDLHFSTEVDIDNEIILLEKDLEKFNNESEKKFEINGFTSIDYIILSGDLSARGEEKEYVKVSKFISKLIEKCDIDAQRVLIIPGNHDYSRTLTHNAYSIKNFSKDFDENKDFKINDKIYLKRNDKEWENKFKYFSEYLYENIYHESFSLNKNIKLIEDKDFSFALINTSTKIDHFNPKNVSFDTNSFINLQNKVSTEKIKFAIGHHPVNYEENYDFVDNLHKFDYRAYIHGHVHRNNLISFQDIISSTKAFIYIGSGLFYTDNTYSQISGVPLRYNIISVDTDTKDIVINTRERERVTMHWRASYLYPSEGSVKSYYINKGQ